MSYTLANLPDDIDRALRERAAAEHKSPEAIIVDLVAGCLEAKTPQTRGSIGHASDFAAAIRDQKLIDWKAWDDGVKRRDLAGIAGQRLISPEMKVVFAEQRRIDPELWK
jgi:plasmid stability protein